MNSRRTRELICYAVSQPGGFVQNNKEDTDVKFVTFHDFSFPLP